MSSRLEAAFGTYARLVEGRLRPPRKRPQGKVSVIANPVPSLREVVEQLEAETAFDDLAAVTREVFSDRDSKHIGHSIWQHAIRNFFRRSGLYLAASRSHPNLTKYASQYEAAFSKSEYEITYLAPLELVRFARPRLQFEGFTIRQFSRAELARILEAETNRAFYPWAEIDAGQLAPYWFLCRTIRRPRPKLLAFWNVNVANLDKVEPYSTPFPSLETALRPLVLYRWQWDLWRDDPIEAQEAWMGFVLPFVLFRTDDLLAAPRRAPDLRDLRTTPVIDSGTGEELGDEPDVAIDLDERETTDFQEIVGRFAKILSRLDLDEHGWQFVSVAGGYLTKAFFAEGMEQLLWHITALEALLGEKGDGMVQRVANRVAVVLGETENERKTLKKQYKDLYEFRSVLVHGGRFKEKVLTKHLREARDLARAVLAWVLTCLAHFQRTAGSGRHLPTRKDLLRLLDMDEATRVRMSKALVKLPADFPRAKAWSSS